MAHNARVRPNLAAWAVATTVTPAEFDQIDLAQYESINGDQGGTWAPATAITIGGSGVEMTGVLQLNRTGDTNYNITTDVAPGTRKAHSELRLGNEYAREYLRASPIAHERTINAEWSGAVFNKDTGSQATRLSHNVNGLELERLQTDGTNTWTDRVSLIARDGNTPANVQTNSLYGINIAKCWGLVTTDGGGGASLVAGSSFNVASVAIVGNAVRVTTQVPFASTSFGGVGSVPSTTVKNANVSAISTTTFDVYSVQAGVTDNLGATAQTLFFVVFGPQA